MELWSKHLDLAGTSQIRPFPLWAEWGTLYTCAVCTYACCEPGWIYSRVQQLGWANETVFQFNSFICLKMLHSEAFDRFSPIKQTLLLILNYFLYLTCVCCTCACVSVHVCPASLGSVFTLPFVYHCSVCAEVNIGQWFDLSGSRTSASPTDS